MSKVIFEFDMPDDQREYEIAKQSNDMHHCLWEFSQQLRAWRKYGNAFTSPKDALSKITDEFYRLIDEHHVNIDL